MPTCQGRYAPPEAVALSLPLARTILKYALFYHGTGHLQKILNIATVEELKHIIWVYYMSYWNNRRICHSIGGLPPKVKRKRYLDAANSAVG